MTITCRICRKNFEQDVFHNLSPAERELLISRTCEICWDNLFLKASER